MNSGKSTSLIQVAYNYRETGLRPFVFKPIIDTKHTKVLSRIGASLVVDYQFTNKDDLFAIIDDQFSQNRPVDCVLVDESQFISVSQADQLMKITVRLDIPVIAYGLRTDFLGNAFPGSQRLLDLAHTIEEIRTKCWYCKSKANYNARQISDGSFLKTGQQILIDDGSEVTYIPLCAKHFDKFVGLP
jgi:thymidine kinase